MATSSPVGSSADRPAKENRPTAGQIWINPHFQPRTCHAPTTARPAPPSTRSVTPTAHAIHVNPAFQAPAGAGLPAAQVHINPHKLHALPVTPLAPRRSPPAPTVRQILVNPHFARVPPRPARPSVSAVGSATAPPPRVLGVSGRSLAKFKKIGRHKLIKMKSPSPFLAAFSAYSTRSGPPTTRPSPIGAGPHPTPHRKLKALAHLRQMLTPKSRRSVHRQIDRRPPPQPAPRPSPPRQEPTGPVRVVSPPRLKPAPPPKPARTIHINGSPFRVSRNGRQLQRVHPRPAPSLAATPGAPISPGAVGTPASKRVYLAEGGEFVEAAPGILRLSRESMTRQSITQARKKSIQTILRSQTKAKQFCMFFNKFGRCQKRAQGLCPYLHDPAKVAVCRRFLQGSCPKSADECLLTHKVSPDKMPACKFFQLGQCGRDHCPYNHVKVSEDAALCRAFRQGFCAQGQACTLRHEMAPKNQVKINPAPPKPKRKVVRDPTTPRPLPPPPTEPADSSGSSKRYFECERVSPSAEHQSTIPDPPVAAETKSPPAFWPEFIALESDDEGASESNQSFEERLV